MSLVSTIPKSLECALVILACGVINAAEYSGNPVIDGWYADPEGIVIDDSYWIFPTYSAPFREQLHMDAFSSKDLVHWEKHPRIIDNNIISWTRQAMWAPCMVEKDDRYFLFFAANDPQHPKSKWWDPDNPLTKYGGIGVAVAADPGGPYKDYLGKPLVSTFPNMAQPIDQFVFKDTDGQYYMIYGGWGVCNITRLNDDFTGFIPWDNGEVFREMTPEGYVEGPFVLLRDGWYYLMWSEGNWTQDSYRVAYAMGRSILGPFDRKGIILESDPEVATGAGHHSVIRVPGTDQHYMVYHRRPIPNESPHHRVTCIDKLEFNQDGTIKPVQMTFRGVPATPINDAHK